MQSVLHHFGKEDTNKNKIMKEMGCFYSEPSPNLNTLGGKWKAGEY